MGRARRGIPAASARSGYRRPAEPGLCPSPRLDTFRPRCSNLAESHDDEADRHPLPARPRTLVRLGLVRRASSPRHLGRDPPSRPRGSGASANGTPTRHLLPDPEGGFVLRISAALPTGMAALLFEAARRRRELEGRMVAELQAAGYSEVILPILDYLEPYEAFLTEAGRAELYRFVDRDGELLALRADFTPMLARLLAPRLPALAPPLRLFYRGDVVRYQVDRAGRRREFYQVGAELLGPEGKPAALEILRLFLRALALGRGAAAAGGARLRRGARPAAARRRRRAPAGGAGGGGGASRARVWGRARGDPPPPGGDRPAGVAGRSRRALGRALGDAAGDPRRAGGEFPAVGLAVDLAEFARQSLDEAPRRRRRARLLRRHPLPRLRRRPRRCRWGAAAATTGCSGRWARRCRRWASRSTWSAC